MLPQIRMDASTGSVIVEQKARGVLDEESRAAELVRGQERGWSRNARAVQNFGGMDEALNL